MMDIDVNTGEMSEDLERNHSMGDYVDENKEKDMEQKTPEKETPALKDNELTVKKTVSLLQFTGTIGKSSDEKILDDDTKMILAKENLLSKNGFVLPAQCIDMKDAMSLEENSQAANAAFEENSPAANAEFEGAGDVAENEFDDNNGDNDEMIIILEDHQENLDSSPMSSNVMISSDSTTSNVTNGNETSLPKGRRTNTYNFQRIKDDSIKTAKTLDDLFPSPAEEEKVDIHQKKQTLDSLFPINSESDCESDNKGNITKRMDQILFLGQNTDVSESEDMKNNQERILTNAGGVYVMNENENLSTDMETSQMEMVRIESLPSSTRQSKENLNGFTDVAGKPDGDDDVLNESASYNNDNQDDKNMSNSVPIQSLSAERELLHSPVEGISLQEILKNIDDDTIIELQFYEDVVVPGNAQNQNVTIDTKDNKGKHKKRQKKKFEEFPTWSLKVKESSSTLKSNKLGESLTWPSGSGESPINFHFQNTMMVAANGQQVLHQYQAPITTQIEHAQPQPVQYRQILPRPSSSSTSESAAISPNANQNMISETFTNSSSAPTGTPSKIETAPYDAPIVTRMDHNDVPFSGMIYSNSGSGFVPLYQQMQQNISTPNRMFEFDPTKRFACGICGKGFHQASSVKTHMRLHTGSKPYKCDICGKGFNQSGNLRNHRRVHTGEKPYKCKYCGKGFSQVGNRQHHVRTHTGEKPFKCRLCNRGFNQSSDLQKHFRTHTGEKPYKCMICRKAFNSSSNLQRHLRTHV
ncbi:uncharacterized protein [Clytia hemisphaerica]|uniref:C2H2-type domain-containing protein n=1 Tax=Clytia hemisphaerica TaxID=252671 RepID=A0A7M5V931_9CNID